MSCNGCRVLRKGCSDSCILRPCLQWIETPEAQGNATVFVAKFFGRAGLMSFISAVPDNQRPALFQSLLFEACGRTINPVNGAVGLLGTGNWHVCQRALETVLRGGVLRPLPEFLGGGGGGIRSSTVLDSNNLGVQSDHYSSRDPYFMRSKAVSKRKKHGFEDVAVKLEASDLNLSLTSAGVVLVPNRVSKLGSSSVFNQFRTEKQRPTTPSSQESGTTCLDDSSAAVGAARDVHSSANRGETKLLRLFV